MGSWRRAVIARVGAVLIAVSCFGADGAAAVASGQSPNRTLDVVVTSDRQEARGEAYLTCGPDGTCVDLGATEWTQPALPVQRRSVIEVRVLGDASVTKVAAVLLRSGIGSSTDTPLGDATRGVGGVWAIQLPDDLADARFVELQFELPSRYLYLANVQLDVVSGVSDDELPGEGVASGGGDGMSSGDLGWAGAAGIGAGVVLLVAVAIAVGVRRRDRRPSTGAL
jgi:hypothetical protein